jgi:hypothetical protein
MYDMHITHISRSFDAIGARTANKIAVVKSNTIKMNCMVIILRVLIMKVDDEICKYAY